MSTSILMYFVMIASVGYLDCSSPFFASKERPVISESRFFLEQSCCRIVSMLTFGLIDPLFRTSRFRQSPARDKQ